MQIGNLPASQKAGGRVAKSGHSIHSSQVQKVMLTKEHIFIWSSSSFPSRSLHRGFSSKSLHQGASLKNLHREALIEASLRYLPIRSGICRDARPHNRRPSEGNAPLIIWRSSLVTSIPLSNFSKLVNFNWRSQVQMWLRSVLSTVRQDRRWVTWLCNFCRFYIAVQSRWPPTTIDALNPFTFSNRNSLAAHRLDRKLKMYVMRCLPVSHSASLCCPSGCSPRHLTRSCVARWRTSSCKVISKFCDLKSPRSEHSPVLRYQIWSSSAKAFRSEML